MKILIAEDEIHIANSLIKNFKEEGHKPVIARDGEKALELISEQEFDAVFLDWRMPKISGIEVCKTLRKSNFNKPIILLTALSDISNKIEALNHGADDYITKPFSFDEVMARLMAVSRRYSTLSRNIIFDNNDLNLFTRVLKTPIENIKLSEKEFDLLKYFLEHQDQIITKEELCLEVWQLPFTPGTNIVEVTIKNLRKKLEYNSEKKYIQSVYGEGYIFIK
jgi:DNA-binding response OmpR family regulator